MLDSRIYPLEITRQAITDYSNIAKISVEFSIDNKYILHFTDLKHDFNLTKSEFCNYLIQLYADIGEGSEQ